MNYISPRSVCNHILITDEQKRTLMITFMRDRFAQNHSAALTRESSATKSIGELQSPHSNHGRMYHFASRERLSNERSWINSATGANTQFFSSETDRDTSKTSFESPKNVSLTRRKHLSWTNDRLKKKKPWMGCEPVLLQLQLKNDLLIPTW